MTTNEREKVVERWFDDLFILGNLDAVNDLVAPDLVAHGQGDTETTRGRENFREWLLWYTSAFSERDWEINDVISEGEKVVFRYSGWATYRGGLLSTPSEDQRVLEAGILILRVRDGLVRELWSEMSDLQLVMQLGALPQAGRGEGGGPGS